MKHSKLFLVVALLVVWLTPRAADAHVGWWDWLDAFSGPGPFDQRSLQVDLRFLCGFDADNQFVVPRDAQGAIDPRAAERSPENQRADEKAVARVLGTAWVPLFGAHDTRDLVRTRQNGGPDQYRVVPTGSRLACLGYSDVADRWVEMRYGEVSTVEKPLFNDRPGEFIGTLTARNLQFALMRRLDPALAIGGGAGVIWFAGKPQKDAPTSAPPILTGKAARWEVSPLSIVFTPFRLVSASRVSSRRAAAWTGVLNLHLDMVLVGSSKATDFNSASTSSFSSKRELLTSLGLSVDATPLLDPLLRHYKK